MIATAGNAQVVYDLLKGGGKSLTNFLQKRGLTKRIYSIAYARRKAVKDAWQLEKELVEATGEGSRRWTKKELSELKKAGKAKGYVGYHINNVKDYPDLAGDANNIKFVKKGDEHLLEHSGNYRNSTSGELIDRKKMIDNYRQNIKSD
ncbi:hypothetical protein [Chitinophaga caeni]|uniref:hypothetical protein n=1 Tax=Chitinophaga caeni TaxID=2029983 RepID=UPI0018E0909F|nr:hypothetical protein [Chitinophaga caeni]